MDLLELKNNRAFPTVHALLIEPFKTIWEIDDTPQKGEAIKVFSYVELMCSPKKSNAFFGYGEEVRGKKVLKEVYKDEDAEVTEWMMLATERYTELLADSSPTYELLITGLKSKDNLVAHLRTIDYKERTPNGAAVYKPKEVIDALNKIPQITKDITTNRDKVQSELEEAAKTRKDREIGDYER